MRSRRGIGVLGETAVCERLRSTGRAIVERNARTRYGELDVIYLDGRALVFAEVKARRGRTSADAVRALESIGPRKRIQVRRLARAWLGERASPGPYDELRFDAFGVAIGPDGGARAIEHVPAAF